MAIVMFLNQSSMHSQHLRGLLELNDPNMFVHPCHPCCQVTGGDDLFILTCPLCEGVQTQTVFHITQVSVV